jgi:hypothetical protein
VKLLASAVLIAVGLWGCGSTPEIPTANEDSQSVVYGNDTREEYHAHPDPRLRARTIESTVALVRPSRLDVSNPDDVRIDHLTLGEDEDLCIGQAYFNQQVGASCSGTLIDWDLVLTAGHCVDDLADCQGLRFIFDLFYEAPGQLATISQQDIFQCRRVVARRNIRDIDYALVQIDRPAAPPRRPAPVNMQSLPLTEGSSVAVIGFPDGIPAKIDSEGIVIWDGAPDYDAFEATLDTFGGNSGSGVYDPQGILVGNLARGEQDYVASGNCFVVNTLPATGDDGDAEGVSYVSRALEGLCADAGWGGALCGQAPGVCSPCANDAMCPEGWTCQSAANGGVTWCSAPCTTDAECPANHTCGSLGCEPEASEICVGDTVWSKNACGREVAPLEICQGPEEICESGACRAADEGNSCADPVALEPISQVIQGAVGLGLSNEHEGSCGGGNGPERVFVIDVDRPVRLQATSEGFDSVLYMRTNCGAPLTERACSDDDEPPGDRGSQINVSLLPGPTYLFVDAFRSAGGDYTLTLEFTDVNPPDAGLPVDTGVEPDTGIEPDSGMHADASVMDVGFVDAGVVPVDAGTPVVAKDEGCGCTTSNSKASAGWLFCALFLFLRRYGAQRTH